MARSALQLTLALIKPDATKIPYIMEDIHKFIISEGFFVVKRSLINLSKPQVEKFYEEHQQKFFYNRLTTFMMSGPIEAMILLREDGIQKWRSMMGPTKVYKTWRTDPYTIRGTWGLTDTRNTTHGSDSPENALKEIALFFPDFNVDKWTKESYDKFRNGQCKFDEENFIHRPS